MTMVAAKQNNKRAFFQGDKLKIDGQLYSVQDLPHLPTDIHTEQGCIREKGDVICFFSRHTPLSNYQLCSFIFDTFEFTSVEQYLQGSKAQVMGDDVIAERILPANNPARQKILD
ncbi:hypothetical protein LSH36_1807g00017 [Paralvinella palmiformis]|uniref:Uncharacterized protein n=1 Tax=Paralvinella palmiformis TaxID=53620 RepID=A0AAD9IRA4_9ANNE|nr:hypothetical protein LSH36_1807g00017 [Paralvinella palmiformis]